MKKSLILITIVFFGWTMVEKTINKIETTANTAVAINNLKNKKKIVKLKASHKKDIAQLKAKNKRNILKTKVKERSKRMTASIPIVGAVIGAVAVKEAYDDYSQWQKDNPGGTRKEYAIYMKELLMEP